MKYLVALLSILSIFLVSKLFLGKYNVQNYWQLKTQIERQKQTNLQLQQDNSLIENDIQDLKQGNDAIEERARLELGMLKKGETFYRIIRRDNQQ